MIYISMGLLAFNTIRDNSNNTRSTTVHLPSTADVKIEYTFRWTSKCGSPRRSFHMGVNHMAHVFLPHPSTPVHDGVTCLITSLRLFLIVAYVCSKLGCAFPLRLTQHLHPVVPPIGGSKVRSFFQVQVICLSPRTKFIYLDVLS
jgi:hypothetical protein